MSNDTSTSASTGRDWILIVSVGLVVLALVGLVIAAVVALSGPQTSGATEFSILIPSAVLFVAGFAVLALGGIFGRSDG